MTYAIALLRKLSSVKMAEKGCVQKYKQVKTRWQISPGRYSERVT